MKLANVGGAVIKSNDIDVVSSVNFDLKMALIRAETCSHEQILINNCSIL
jgi:hypothetical protein